MGSSVEAEVPPQRPSGEQREHDEIERIPTASSSSSSVSSGPLSISRRSGMSRVPTQRDLERHPTELGRIQTEKSQHNSTVGRSATSKSKKRPPPWGKGLPYPPAPANQEEYVVEFDGVDDPLHAQNWPLRKK